MSEGLADALLAAHVNFIVKDISSARLQAMIESRLDLLLSLAEKLQLNDVVTPDMIKTTAKRYACEVELSVAVPELAAAIGRASYLNPVHDHTRLSDLMPDRHLQEFIDKGLELRHVRDAILSEIVDNPQYSSLLADVLLQTIKQHFGRQIGAGDFLGMRQMMSFSINLMGKSTPQVSVMLEEAARDFIGQSVSAILHETQSLLQDATDSDILKNAVLDIWQQVRDRTTGSFRDMISTLDVEEFFVILYDYWRMLRRTKFYAAFIDSGIDAFFEKYGDVSLTDLLGEVGITRELMLADAMRFAPHVIKVLKRKKMLEMLVRHELEPFYRSGQLEQVVAGYLAQASGVSPVKSPAKSPSKESDQS